MDRDVFGSLLNEGERADCFVRTSSIVEQYYGEQTVVTTGDREEFRLMVEGVLQEHRLPVFTSQKNFSKRMKWL